MKRTRRGTSAQTLLDAVLLCGISLSLLSLGAANADEFCSPPLPEASTASAGQAVISDLDAALAGQGGGCVPWEYGNPALFYNFYVPNNCGGAPAALYIAPRPVPPLVGHAYYTYQPLMPHEMLYPHHRTYRNWYDDGRGLTRAHVVWYRGPVTSIAKNLHQAVRLPR